LLAWSPIVLDLNGDGVSTVSAAHGVNFDLNATGHANKVGWASSTDGILVMDRNGDGKINDGTELFGVATVKADGTRAGNGYEAMKIEDTNHDGKLSAADANFDKLKVWVDANQDGISEAGELKGLADFGIVSLDLHAASGTTVQNGNLLGLVSSYTTADGAKHDMADVWFGKAAATDATAAKELPVQLADVLAAPTADVLGGSSAPTVAATQTTAHAAVHVDHKLLADDEHLKNIGPLI